MEQVFLEIAVREAEVIPGHTQFVEANVANVMSVVANLTPFRGPSADPGTVYELGWMIGRGKRALGYSNDPRDLAARVAPDGLAVEDFGEADNLMLACGLSEGGFPLLRGPALMADPMLDFSMFEACLRALRG
jgi:nucleoside 2-deoxyribosyltransferase